MKKLTLLSILFLSFSFGVFATDTRITEEEEKIFDNYTFNIVPNYLKDNNIIISSFDLENNYHNEEVLKLTNFFLSKENKFLNKEDMLKVNPKDTSEHVYILFEKYSYEQYLYLIVAVNVYLYNFILQNN